MLDVIIGRHTWIAKYARTYIRRYTHIDIQKKNRKREEKKGKLQKGSGKKERKEKEKDQKEIEGKAGGEKLWREKREEKWGGGQREKKQRGRGMGSEG